MKSRRLACLVVPALVCFAQSSVGQTTYFWRSESTNGNWSDSNNWWAGANATPPGAEILEFNNAVQTSMTNDLVSTNRFRINFQSGSGARTISGTTENTFYDFSSAVPAIYNNSGNTQTIQFKVINGNSNGANRLELNANSGDLVLSGGVSASGGTRTVVAMGSSQVTFSAAITQESGATLQFRKEGSGTTILAAANTYTGATQITAGTLRLSGSGAIGSGSDVTISSGATLDLNGVDATIASLSETGTSNGGTVTLGSATLTINGANKGTRYQNSISGTGGITMAGSGTTTLALYGTQGYTGTTSVSGGKITSGVALASSAVSVSGGEFEATADNVLANAATLTISGGTLDLQGSDTVASLAASNAGAVTIGSGKTITLTNGGSVANTATLTGGTLALSGGTLSLGGTGSSTSAVSVGNSSTLKGTGTTSGAVTVASGGTLAPGNSPGVLSTGALSFDSGSIFEWELDTAQSNPETNRGVAYDGVNASSVSGTGAKFLIKLTGTQDFADAFWDQSRQWADIIKNADGTAVLTNWASVFSGGFDYSYNGKTVAPSSEGAFTLSGNTLSWSAVPEPSNALVGLLLAAGLLRRRRR